MDIENRNEQLMEFVQYHRGSSAILSLENCNTIMMVLDNRFRFQHTTNCMSTETVDGVTPDVIVIAEEENPPSSVHLPHHLAPTEIAEDGKNGVGNMDASLEGKTLVGEQVDIDDVHHKP